MHRDDILTVSIKDEFGVTHSAAIRDTADEINTYLREHGYDLGDTEIDPEDDGHYIVRPKATSPPK